jgi:hypothetical protein
MVNHDFLQIIRAVTLFGGTMKLLMQLIEYRINGVKRP